MMATPSHAHRGGGHWTPATRLGTWTLSLAGFALGGTVALATAFAAGLERGESFSDNLYVTTAGAAILLCAAASVVTGGLARLRDHDDAWSVVVAVVVGALLTLSTLQQVAEGLGWLTG